MTHIHKHHAHKRVTTAPTAVAAPAIPAQKTSARSSGATPVHLRLLALNDFHGQLTDSAEAYDGIPIGGAATLATYLKQARAGDPNGSFTVMSGDAFGASEPASTLLDHESSIAALAAMGVQLATFGNHEFDRGAQEILRLIHGGTPPALAGVGTGQGAVAQPKWPGSPYPWVSCNVVYAKTGKTVLPPYAIRTINGVKVAFIGAVTKSLKDVTVAAGIRDLKVLDPTKAINAIVPQLQQQGVHTIVVFIHEGGENDPKTGKVTGPIVDIAKHLNPDVDVIFSAHSHQVYAQRIGGKMVTQAGAYARGFSQADLEVDPATDQVLSDSAKIVLNDQRKVKPDAQVAAMVQRDVREVSPITQRIVSVLPGKVTRDSSPAGESALGDLIAAAQMSFAGTQICLMNPGGIRQDITKGGAVTYGALFSVQPFANHVIKENLTGAQIVTALEEMFHKQPEPDKILQIAGLHVVFDTRKPIGHRVIRVTLANGQAINPAQTYSVAVNSFLAQGGDDFSVLAHGTNKHDVGVDLDALVQYLAAGKPVPLHPMGYMQNAAHAAVKQDG